MRTPLTILAALLSLVTVPAGAFADHQYAPTGASQKQPFDVYTDGKNTYIEAIKGLVVRGAPKEGDSYVITGVPDRFLVQLNGKSLVIARTGSPVVRSANLVSAAAPDVVQDREQPPRPEADTNARPALSEDERAQLQAEVRAQVSAEVLAQLQSQLREAKDAAAAGQFAKINAGIAPEVASMSPAPAEVASLPAAKTAVPEPAKPAEDVAATSVTSVALEAPNTITESAPNAGAKAGEATAAPASQPLPPPPPSAPIIATIKLGSLIHDGLKQRAVADGWTFIWYPTVSWEAIGDIDLTRYKSADEAVDDIVTGLREEGKPIQLRISEGNKIMEVLSTEVKHD